MKGHIKAIEILGMDKISVDKVARLVDVTQFTLEDVTMCYSNKCRDLGKYKNTSLPALRALTHLLQQLKNPKWLSGRPQLAYWKWV